MNSAEEAADASKEGKRKRKKVFLFGHYGGFNSGNDCTLKAMLCNLRRFVPEAEAVCICGRPESVPATHGIEAVPIKNTAVSRWNPRGRPAKLLRKLFIGIPSEACRWLDAFSTLKGSQALIIPGAGLLTDAFGFRVDWGPYNLFKWCLMAKLCRCKLLFVSVGAGPIYSRLGGWFVKSTLSLADFRSYRDEPSMRCIEAIGLRAKDDRVYPDLVFSLPEAVMPLNQHNGRRRRVVGLGLMHYVGRYSVANPSRQTFAAYLETLVVFSTWLLAHEYDIRLLIGDVADRPIMQEFKSLLSSRIAADDAERISGAPGVSVEEVLMQLASTDIVVATRFHNALLALLLGKPVISISFHHKCASLMDQMGLSEYCFDINQMDAGKLIDRFREVEKNAEKLRPLIRQKVEDSRKALEEQYKVIFNRVLAR